MSSHINTILSLVTLSIVAFVLREKSAMAHVLNDTAEYGNMDLIVKREKMIELLPSYGAQA